MPNCVYRYYDSTCVTTDCSGYYDIYQCYRNSCIWQYGYGCIKHIRCDFNTSATLNYHCELLSPKCKLNYRNGQGCQFRSCSDITDQQICNGAKNFHSVKCYYDGYCLPLSCSSIGSQSQCIDSYGYFDSAQTIVLKCYWCSGACSFTNQCSSNISNPPISHYDCNYLTISKTIASDTFECTFKKTSCTDYLYYKQCVSTIQGHKCQWDRFKNPRCFDYCLTKAQAGLTHDQCQTYHSQCVANSTADKCILLVCSNYTTNTTCDSITNLCMWDPIDSICVKYETYLYCHRFDTEANCNAGLNSDNRGCLWDLISLKCVDRSCSNYDGTPTSQLDCDTWLQNCVFDSVGNVCIADCTIAPLSKQYDTVSECETFFQDRSCTIVPDLKQCQNLFPDCTLYLIDQMCKYDYLYNTCYWSVQQNKCFTLDNCTILDSDNNSHLKCNQIYNKCTVNQTLTGCIELDDCINYTQQSQCVIDKNNIDCEWKDSSCLIKSCQTATLTTYIPINCKTYFPKSVCTSNNNQDGCFEGYDECKKYTMVNCSLSGQVNSSGVFCFWDLDQSRCREKICQNAPANFQTNLQCEGFLDNKQCQLIGCKQVFCSDYAYRNDDTCKSAMEDFKCTTNGYECVDRAECENALLEDACTFDISMKECQWLDHPIYKCVVKQCNTASVELKTHDECQKYLEGCTNTIEGGCTILLTCSEIKTQDGCKKDINNEECIWDSFYKQCFFNTCEGFCGDGMIQSSLEECDDANYLPYDGCYDCKIQCPLGCVDCNGVVCQKCNQLQGYYYDTQSQQCETKCGDKIINGQEYCDDGNDIEFDGCYNCEYSCDFYCMNCFQGQCIECPEGFYENGPFCNNRCGDGILNTIFEECDDGNTKIDDGCNQNCVIETNWRCRVILSTSECYYLIYPKIILTLLTKQTEQTQEVKLSFSEKVKLNNTQVTPEDFQNQIQLVITNIDNIDFTFNIVPIHQIQYDLSETQYMISLTIKEQIQNPKLKVIIKSKDLVNQYDNQLFVDNQEIILNDSFMVSDSTKSVAASAAFLNQIIIYCVLALAIVSFLSGNLEILYNLIDILQQLSYIRFININFPYHLDLYFDVFGFITLQPLLDYIKFNSFFEDYLNLETPEVFPYGKFTMFGVNAYFGVNFQSFLACMLIGLLNYFIATIITHLLKKPRIGWGDNPSKFTQFLYMFVMKVYQFLFSIAFSYMQYFFFSGLIRILLSNYYDLTFSALLQVINFDTQTTLLKYSSVLATVTLILNASLIILFYASLSKKNVFQKRLFVLVDGLNIGRNQWNKQFNTVTLLKKLFFIYTLVLLQDSPLFQTLLISFISASFAIYVLLLEPFEHKFENYKIIATEISVSFNTFSFIVYSENEIFNNSDFSNKLGWLNILIFSISLTFSLALDSYSQFIQLKKLFQKLSKPKLQKQKIKITTTRLFTVVGENEITF